MAIGGYVPEQLKGMHHYQPPVSHSPFDVYGAGNPFGPYPYFSSPIPPQFAPAQHSSNKPQLRADTFFGSNKQKPAEGSIQPHFGADEPKKLSRRLLLKSALAGGGLLALEMSPLPGIAEVLKAYRASAQEKPAQLAAFVASAPQIINDVVTGNSKVVVSIDSGKGIGLQSTVPIDGVKIDAEMLLPQQQPPYVMFKKVGIPIANVTVLNDTTIEVETKGLLPPKAELFFTDKAVTATREGVSLSGISSASNATTLQNIDPQSAAIATLSQRPFGPVGTPEQQQHAKLMLVGDTPGLAVGLGAYPGLKPYDYNLAAPMPTDLNALSAEDRSQMEATYRDWVGRFFDNMSNEVIDSRSLVDRHEIGKRRDRKNDALAVYDDAIFKTFVPHPVLRAALASLVGTVGEPSIDRIKVMIRDGEGSIPFGQIRFATAAEFNNAPMPLEQAALVKGKWETQIWDKLSGEDPALIGIYLAHRCVHADFMGSNPEEGTAQALESTVYLQQLLANPAIATMTGQDDPSMPTGLTRLSNTTALARLNSGKLSYPLIGTDKAPFAEVFPGGIHYDSMRAYSISASGNTASVVGGAADFLTDTMRYMDPQAPVTPVKKNDVFMYAPAAGSTLPMYNITNFFDTYAPRAITPSQLVQVAGIMKQGIATEEPHINTVGLPVIMANILSPLARWISGN